MAPFRPGDVLAGKYRVERVLGEGGMGVVVLAQHLKLEQLVAIKTLHDDVLADPHIVARFGAEARAAAKIQSEHVARVLDVGTDDAGAPFMVMEYLEGRDLADVLRERGPLPLEEVATTLLQACEALAEAHAAGIVHRDLKPSNLFLAKRRGGRPSVKLLDFGISKLAPGGARDDASEAGRGLTRTRAIMGTPHYMSPEQIRSTRDVDARSDVWALGVILFELLTGELPFDGETPAGIIAAIAAEPARPLRSLRAELPASVEALVAGCLEKDRARRCPSVVDFAAALAPFAQGQAAVSLPRITNVIHGVVDTLRPPAAQPLDRPPPAATSARPETRVEGPVVALPAPPRLPKTDVSWGESTPSPAPRGRRVLAAVGAVALVAGVAVAAVWMTRAPAASTASSAPSVPVASGPGIALAPLHGASAAASPDAPAPSASSRPAAVDSAAQSPVVADAGAASARASNARVPGTAPVAPTARATNPAAPPSPTPTSNEPSLHMGIK